MVFDLYLWDFGLDLYTERAPKIYFRICAEIFSALRKYLSRIIKKVTIERCYKSYFLIFLWKYFDKFRKWCGNEPCSYFRKSIFSAKISALSQKISAQHCWPAGKNLQPWYPLHGKIWGTEELQRKMQKKV